MTERTTTATVLHNTFTVERTYPTTPEQDAFLDGKDSPISRDQGTIELLDALGRALADG